MIACYVRLLRVDLIKWVSNVRPSTNSFFDFNEIWYVGRGRWVVHDGMQYDAIQGQLRSRSWALESRKFCHFQRLSPLPFLTGAGKWPRIL